MASALDRNQLYSFAKSHRKQYETLLKSFVQTPTVSSDPGHAEDIRAGVDLTVETFRQFGGKVDVYKADRGNPTVHAVFDSTKNAPTVTVYNHMDVQPASKETEPWDTEPFVMTNKGDSYFGRGTTDDKGPALAALYGARAAQEAGLRGLLGFILTLETGATDTHSGETGGASRNPIAELMRLVCDLYDPLTGKIKFKGFYDDVIPPSKSELNDWVNSGFTVKGFKKAHHLKLMRSEDQLEVMKRIWGMPTMEIHGVVGGYQGPGVKSIVPP